MKKQILKYTIRVNKKSNEIEVFIKDYPPYMRVFTCISSKGETIESIDYYLKNTRRATDDEISKADSNVINNFLSIYSDDYDLQYLKRL